MAITISGSGITSANIADGTIVNADVNDVAASKLTGALPAISGASLTNLPGGGKVLQVVQATSTSSTYPTTSWTAISGASIAITPSSTSSKILVTFSIAGVATNASTGNLSLRIKRGATNIRQMDKYGTVSTVAIPANISINYLDSPSTTSATTYSLDAHVGSAHGWDINDGGAPDVLVVTAMEIGA